MMHALLYHRFVNVKQVWLKDEPGHQIYMATLMNPQTVISTEKWPLAGPCEIDILFEVPSPAAWTPPLQGMCNFLHFTVIPPNYIWIIALPPWKWKSDARV